MAKDLKRELSDTNGFSRTNLFAMRKFYSFFKESELIHQAGGRLKIDDFPESNTIAQQVAGLLEKTGSNLSSPIVQQAVGQLAPNIVICKIP
jgi:hypothetical protein